MAFNFNGSGNYLSATGFTGVDGSSQLSISAWYWMNAVSTSSSSFDFGAFCSNAGGSSTLLWYNAIGAPSDNCFTFNVGDTGSASNRIDSTDNSGNQALQQWCHVVGTMNGGSRRIYVNGTLSRSGTGGTGTVPDFISSSFRIGGWNSGTFTGNNNKLADIGVWNRELTAAEVYGLSRGLTCDHIPRSLVLYFPLLRNFNNIRSSQTISEVGSVPVYDPHPRLSGIGR